MNKKSAGLTALIRAFSRAFNTESLDLPPVIGASYPELRLYNKAQAKLTQRHVGAR
jgi:hypothetical protein